MWWEMVDVHARMHLKVCVRRTLIWQGEGGVKALLNEFSLQTCDTVPKRPVSSVDHCHPYRRKKRSSLLNLPVFEITGRLLANGDWRGTVGEWNTVENRTLLANKCAPACHQSKTCTVEKVWNTGEIVLLLRVLSRWSTRDWKLAGTLLRGVNIASPAVNRHWRSSTCTRQVMSIIRCCAPRERWPGAGSVRLSKASFCVLVCLSNRPFVCSTSRSY